MIVNHQNLWANGSQSHFYFPPCRANFSRMALRMNFERSESSLLTPSSRQGSSDFDTQTESSLPFRRFPTRFMTWCIYLVYKTVNENFDFFCGREGVYDLCVKSTCQRPEVVAHCSR